MELSTRRTTAFETTLKLEDGELCLKTDANADIKTAALLIDGEPLALTWAARDHEWSARIDDVASATLVVGLRAVAPVRDVDGALLITLNKRPLGAPQRYTLTGSARTIAGRSGWKASKNALPFGEWTPLRLRLRNDGDADFPGGFAMVKASAGCSVSGEGERVPGRDGMLLRIAIPTLRVGAAADLTIGVRPCDPTVDAITIEAKTPLGDEPLAATFDLVQEAPSLKLELQEAASIRFGEQLLVRAVLSTGSHRTPAGTLDVALEPGGSTAVSFGALGAHERRALYVPVSVTERTLARGPAMLTGVLHEGGTPIARATHEVAIDGNYGVDLRIHVDEADDTNAHTLHIAVRNTGDLALHDLCLTLDARPQLAAVRDSAWLDGEALLELDGSVPIFDKGIVIDVLPIGAARELTVRLRHAKGKVITLSATAAIGETALAVASSEAMFVNGGTRKKADADATRSTSTKKKAEAQVAPPDALAQPVASDSPTVDESQPPETVEGGHSESVATTDNKGVDAEQTVAEVTADANAAQTEAAGDVTATNDVETAEQPSAAADETEGAAKPVAVEPAAAEEAQPEAEPIYSNEIPAASIALGQPNAPLGYHVAAALGLQPHGHTTDADFGVAALRLWQVAMQSLELAAKTHQLGVYGASGYGVPAAILEAIADIQRARRLAVPADDIAAMRVLVSLADVQGARSRDVHRWRRIVGEALEKVTSLDELGAPLDSALKEEAAA